MNRRDFLIGLGLIAAAPKLIFDMGKNSRLYTVKEILPSEDFYKTFDGFVKYITLNITVSSTGSVFIS